MSAFADSAAREWTLRLDYAKARRLRETCGLDFVDFDGLMAAFAKIDSSRDLFVQVLAELLIVQIETRNVTVEQFWEGLGGDSFEAARVALEECVVNFFPPRERETLQAALTMQAMLRKELISQAVNRLHPVAAGGG